MNKVCYTCKINKSVLDFNKNKSKTDGYGSSCKSCQYIMQKKWYNKDPENQKNRVRKREQEIKNWINDYKKNLKCSKCEFDHPAALDFHHQDEKLTAVATAVARGWSKEKILEEINKCIVLCSNCHRIHHYNERTD